MRAVFTRMRARVSAWLAKQGENAGLEYSVLLLALVGHVIHYLAFCLPQPWYIEDAAISFAYARNWIEGWGLVPFVGAEHVEGYSNPLWTYLLGFWHLIGVSPWTSSKVMGAVFGCLAQVVTWALVRRSLPVEKRWVALLAPCLLAGSTQFALWNSSGLENSLFCLLLSLGIYRVVVEVEEDRRIPLSAVAFFLLTMTRPEGLAYAGIGLAARVLGALVYRQWTALLLWVAAFAVPYALYFGWRMETFAWEWPNTWYAKKKDFRPNDWNTLGWKQMREYMWNYGILWATPLIAMGVVGFSRWRKKLIFTLLAAMTLVLAWDGKWGIPAAIKGDATVWLASHWIAVRVNTLASVAALLGLASFGQKGWLVRGILWCCYSFGLFYTILATGDWMKGYRWYSLTAIPQFALITLGLAEFMDRMPLADLTIKRLRLSAAYAVIPVMALIAPNPFWSWKFDLKPETGPRDVHKRVEYMRWVQSRLGLDRVTLFEVDMGAHLWWTDWFIADIAGLVDVPMGHHEYEKAFLKEYLFEEVRPTFAHVHGSWANTIRIGSHPEWAEQYIEIPGYPSGKRGLHVGNHIRKDLLASDVAPASQDRRVRFGEGVRLETWSVPAPTVTPGGELFLDTQWRASKRESGVRVLCFLEKDGAVAWSGEVVPAYGWYKPAKWQPWEYIRGAWSMALPDDLAKGDYRFGVVVLDEKTGVVLPLLGAGPGGEPLWGEDPEAASLVVEPPLVPAPALYMTGEYVFPGLVHVVSGNDARAAADIALTASKASAAAGDCENAQARWDDARHHVFTDQRWKRTHLEEANDGIVACLLGRAAEATDPIVAAGFVAEARYVDPKNARLEGAARPIGATLDAAGLVAAEAKDWELAFDSFLAAVQADPSRSLSRRRAEDMRDRRLKIRDYDPKKGTKDIATEPVP